MMAATAAVGKVLRSTPDTVEWGLFDAAVPPVLTERGLTTSEASMLCSRRADMCITQTVNGHKGVRCVMPKPADGTKG
jgi:hypothetical protein